MIIDFETLNKTLESGIGFIPDELQVNREGRLSEQQRMLIDERLNTMWRNGRWTVIVFLAFYGGLFAISIVNESRRQHVDFVPYILSQRVPLSIAFGGLCGLLLVSLLGTLFIGREAKRGTVRQIEGKAKPFIGTGRGRYGTYPRYELTIRGSGFHKKFFRLTDPKIARAFREGYEYRVYYVKFYPIDILLSAETLSKGNDYGD